MYYNEQYEFLTILLLITFLFFMYFSLSSLYHRWCLPGSRSHHISRSRTMVFLPPNPSHPASRGLDPAVLESLPVFIFSSAATHMDLIDCAVCLSEFEEGESGRVLPGCKHSFHVECIDMWFHSHSTCPLCRSLVEPPARTVEEQVSIIITIPPEPGSISGSGTSAMPLEEAPMSRMLSFTRMLSTRSKKRPVFFCWSSVSY